MSGEINKVSIASQPQPTFSDIQVKVSEDGKSATAKVEIGGIKHNVTLTFQEGTFGKENIANQVSAYIQSVGGDVIKELGEAGATLLSNVDKDYQAQDAKILKKDKELSPDDLKNHYPKLHSALTSTDRLFKNTHEPTSTVPTELTTRQDEPKLEKKSSLFGQRLGSAFIMLKSKLTKSEVPSEKKESAQKAEAEDISPPASDNKSPDVTPTRKKREPLPVRPQEAPPKPPEKPPVIPSATTEKPPSGKPPPTPFTNNPLPREPPPPLPSGKPPELPAGKTLPGASPPPTSKKSLPTPPTKNSPLPSGSPPPLTESKAPPDIPTTTTEKPPEKTDTKPRSSSAPPQPSPPQEQINKERAKSMSDIPSRAPLKPKESEYQKRIQVLKNVPKLDENQKKSIKDAIKAIDIRMNSGVDEEMKPGLINNKNAFLNIFVNDYIKDQPDQAQLKKDWNLAVETNTREEFLKKNNISLTI